MTLQLLSWTFTPEIWKFRFTQKPVYKFICDSQRLEITRTSIHRWTAKQVWGLPNFRIRRNGSLIRASTWWEDVNIATQNERSQIQKSTPYVIPFTQTSRKLPRLFCQKWPKADGSEQRERHGETFERWQKCFFIISVVVIMSQVYAYVIANKNCTL